VREALVDTALEQCRGQLADFRANPVYPQVLRRLLQEALAELENCLAASESGRGICLEADPRDRDTIGVFLTELGLSLTVDYTLSTWGGLIARSEDGRVAVINTLEARLERATPYLRRSLAALFESDSQESVESRMLEAAGSKR
jgi:vacuolar-type H+-ATPase subunit E/Vma4